MFRLANWIWVESLDGTPNSYIYARREFNAQNVSHAEAIVSCTSEYSLYLNGRSINHGSGVSGGRYYNTHDLSHIIRPGKNVIGAICHSRGDNIPAGFILKLMLFVNGKEHVIVTDKTWRVSAGREWDFGSRQIGPDLGSQEICDSRRRPVGWNVVGYDDSAWDEAHIVSKSADAPMRPREIPLLRETVISPNQITNCGPASTQPDRRRIKYANEMLLPSGDAAVISPGQDCFVVIDFGKVLVGRFGIKIRSAGESTVEISYDLFTDATGAVAAERGEISQYDRLTLHGGRQTWQSYGRRTFRYVQLYLRNLNTALSIDSVYAACISYPTEQISSFECSDDALNDIWQSGVHTLSLSMQDDYESNPYSSHKCRPAAARLQALANYYTFFDSALAAKTLGEMAESSDIGVSWLTMLYEYLLHTGDLALAHQCYNLIRRCVENANKDDRHLLFRNASKLAKALNRPDDALEWYDLSKACDASTSSSFSLQTLQQLASQDNMDAALDMIRSHWKETLRPWWSACAGDNLGAAIDCIPVYFLPSELLGVKPSAPGTPDITIQPRPGSLTHAKGRIKTVLGFAEVQWHIKDGVFSLEIEYSGAFIVGLPAGRFQNPVIDEIDLTPETPERRARKTYGWGTVIWRDDEEHDPYLDWLATQQSKPPAGFEPKTRLYQQDSYVWIRQPISSHVRYEIHDA